MDALPVWWIHPCAVWRIQPSTRDPHWGSNHPHGIPLNVPHTWGTDCAKDRGWSVLRGVEGSVCYRGGRWESDKYSLRDTLGSALCTKRQVQSWKLLAGNESIWGRSGFLRVGSSGRGSLGELVDQLLLVCTTICGTLCTICTVSVYGLLHRAQRLHKVYWGTQTCWLGNKTIGDCGGLIRSTKEIIGRVWKLRFGGLTFRNYNNLISQFFSENDLHSQSPKFCR